MLTKFCQFLRDHFPAKSAARGVLRSGEIVVRFHSLAESLAASSMWFHIADVHLVTFHSTLLPLKEDVRTDATEHGPSGSIALEVADRDSSNVPWLLDWDALFLLDPACSWDLDVWVLCGDSRVTPSITPYRLKVRKMLESQAWWSRSLRRRRRPLQDEDAVVDEAAIDGSVSDDGDGGGDDDPTNVCPVEGGGCVDSDGDPDEDLLLAAHQKLFLEVGPEHAPTASTASVSKQGDDAPAVDPILPGVGVGTSITSNGIDIDVDPLADAVAGDDPLVPSTPVADVQPDSQLELCDNDKPTKCNASRKP